MQNRISYIGLAGFLAGVVMFVSISDLPELSALFPKSVAWALIVIGVIEIIRNYVVGTRDARRAAQASRSADPAQAPADEETESGAGGQVRPVLIFAGATIGYVALIPVVGFYVMTILFMIGLMLALGVRKIILCLGVPIVITAIVYLTFTLQLNVPLPEGVLL